MVDQTVHKVHLLADNVILYLTDPSCSLIRLQTLLDTYGAVSGYFKVNYDKSEIVPLTPFNHSECQGATVFKWVTDGIKYLGIVGDNLNVVPVCMYIH